MNKKIVAIAGTGVRKTIQQYRILLVEDQSIIALRMTHKLEKYGYDVISVCSSGEEAVRLAGELKPDLVLMDIGLQDGPSAGIAAAKTISKAINIPIIYLTSITNPIIVEEALNTCPFCFLDKPVSEQVLDRTIRLVIKRHQAELTHIQRLLAKFRLPKIEAGQTAQGIEKTIELLITTMLEFSALRDNETGNHLRRVRAKCARVFEHLIASDFAGIDVDPARREWIVQLEGEGRGLISYAMTLHDIGKVGITDNILLKPASLGRLTDQEFETMKTHVQLGIEVLNKIRSLNTLDEEMLQMFYQIADQGIAHHHEKYDGSGYPNGLKGNQISLAGRAIALVDVHDALSHARIYKPAWPKEKVLALIREEKGKHFDPILADIVLNLHAEFEQIDQEFPD